MFTHVMIGSNDLEQARRFYDATFVALGSEPGEMDARGRLIYAYAGGRLMITAPIDGQPATAANGGTIGLAATSRDHVLAWHEAGTAHGGMAIESPARGESERGLRRVSSRPGWKQAHRADFAGAVTRAAVRAGAGVEHASRIERLPARKRKGGPRSSRP